MRDNFEVNPFSLKQIVENLGKIPRDGGASFGNEIKKLSPQDKKDLMEKVNKFNEYGRVLRCETALMEMSQTLSEIATKAEAYAMTESSDYFQSEVVKRDFKEVKKITGDFSKLAKECYGRLQQLNALYEDMGGKMGRYFEIQSLDEIASAANTTPIEEGEEMYSQGEFDNSPSNQIPTNAPKLKMANPPSTDPKMYSKSTPEEREQEKQRIRKSYGMKENEEDECMMENVLKKK
jgi:hypothetical protein